MKIPATNQKLSVTPSPAQIKMVQWFDEHWYRIDHAIENVLQTSFFASVTTKLGITAKPYIARWRGDLGNREADMRVFEAQQRGTRLHNAWYVFSTGGLVIYNPWNKPIFTPEQVNEQYSKYSGNVAVISLQDEMLHLVKLYRWVKAVQPEFLFSQKTVYSLKNRDAGTVDTIVKISGGVYEVNGAKPLAIPAGVYVLDLKTGAQVDNDAYLQTAAYLKCAEEMDLVKDLNGTIILHTQGKNRSGIEGLSTILHTMPDVEEHYKEYRLVSTLWERRNAEASPKVFEFPATLQMSDIKAA